MADFPYTLKPSGLEDFLNKMHERPEPSTKVSRTYLSKLGYTSSNDRAIIPILKFIGFLDRGSGITDLFKAYRDTEKSRAVMAQALRKAYADLFNKYADPCKENLENYFRTSTGRGGRALQATENTFKTLCNFADFGLTAVKVTPTAMPAPTKLPKPAKVQLPVTREGAVNINVNIKFELPITTDADVYDKIFASLKKHLLSESSKAD